MKIPALLRIYLRIYLICLLLLIGNLLFFTDFGKLFLNDSINSIITFSDEWTAPDGSIVNLDDIAAGQYGESALFSKTLPKGLKPNDELCFITSNSNVTVWVVGTVSYEFTALENITGRGYGRAYHTVNLGAEDSGTKVYLRLSSVFRSNKGGRITSVCICEAPVFRAYALKGSLIPFILSVFITISGILIIILRWGIPKNQKLPYNLVALGAALTIAGLWLTGDTGVLQVIFGHIRFWRGVAYLLLLFSITPGMCWIST